MANNLSPHILIIEDSPTLALTYQAYLKPVSSDITIAGTGTEGLKKLAKIQPHLLILDLKLPDMDGLDILRGLSDRLKDIKVIVITAHGSVTTAVDAMREGATDFLLKPFTAERLVTTARNALELQRLTKIVKAYKGESDEGFGSFIGTSPPMQVVYRMIKDAAGSRASVFITGESGTGKEVCAETLHKTGPRAKKPFVALNCAAIPANLIESEIFGHKKGAFTGATEDRDGAAMGADGGTLFLDEICEMPLELQAKMLRFIQTGQVVPVGSTTPITANVRFICATNRSPWDEVLEGRFREDLYYRLHVIPIHLPPLRTRGDDIVLLTKTFLSRFSAEEEKTFTGISTNAEDLLMAYQWPGNVRELANVIQSAVVLKDGPTLNAKLLTPLLGPTKGRSRSHATIVARQQATRGLRPDHTAAHTDSALTDLDTVINSPSDRSNWYSPDIEPLDSVERRHVERALRIKGGNITKAAVSLGVHPTTLYRKIKNWEKESA